jgi:hypothetical protein
MKLFPFSRCLNSKQQIATAIISDGTKKGGEEHEKNDSDVP